METKLWLHKLQKSNGILMAALAAGILLRLWFVFFKDLNLDQATTLGFIQNEWWGSIWWDNSPPLVYILGKSIKAICGADMDCTLMILKFIIFLTSTISLCLMVNLLKSKASVSWLWIFGLCVFPVALVDTTVIRPTFLTEFFAILNFVIFLRIRNQKSRFWHLIVFAVSSFGLLASSYLAAIYFAGLLFYYLNSERVNFLKPIEFFNKNNRFMAIVLLATLTSLIVGFVLLFEIRWENLSWIGGNSSAADSMMSSLFWIRNLLGYNWLALVLLVFGIVYDRKWILFLPIFFLFGINLLTERVAEEPRFLIFLWPLLFYWILQMDQTFSGKKWYFFFRYLMVLVWVWQTAWFLKEPRSSLSAAQLYVQDSKVDSVVVEISSSALDYLFKELPQISWPESAQIPCPYKTALLSPLHRPQYEREKHLQQAKDFGFEIESERLFSSMLESIEVIVFKKNCQK